jgi:choline dehydrogenase-like flavoprotein
MAARLRVHGVHGPGAVDASIMPSCTSGNTISERAAAWKS